MKCVRLPLLTRDFLMGNVDTELLVRHHSECKDLLIEALKYHLMPEQRGVLSNCRTRPRRCEGASPVLFAVGQYIKIHFQYFNERPVSSSCQLSNPLWSLSGGGSLFAIHGDCEAYDTRTDRWHMVASMSTRRARVGVAAIGNKLYAVGGYGASYPCLWYAFSVILGVHLPELVLAHQWLSKRLKGKRCSSLIWLPPSDYKFCWFCLTFGFLTSDMTAHLIWPLLSHMILWPTAGNQKYLWEPGGAVWVWQCFMACYMQLEAMTVLPVSTGKVSSRVGKKDSR